MRHPSPHRVLVALLVAVFALVAGCGGGGGGNPLPKAQPPSAAPTPTDPGVAVAGVEPEDLDVTDDTGISPGANLSFVSPVYSVTTAKQLTAPTKMQLTLDNAIPRTSVVYVVTRSAASNPWTYLPARLMVDQKHVEFSTSHLSQFAVLLMDVDGALQTFRDEVRSRLGGGRRRREVKKPRVRPDGQGQGGRLLRRLLAQQEDVVLVLRARWRQARPQGRQPACGADPGLARRRPRDRPERLRRRRGLHGSTCSASTRPCSPRVKHGDVRRRPRAPPAGAHRCGGRLQGAVAAGVPGNRRRAGRRT